MRPAAYQSRRRSRDRSPPLASGALSGIVRRAMGKSSDDDDDKAKDAAGEAEDSNENPDAGDEDEGGAPGKDDDEAAAAEVKSEPEGKAPAKASSAAVNAALLKGAPAKSPVAARPPPTAGLGKSVTLFVGVVAGISLLMLALGNERGQQGTAPPKWKEGEKVDVEITLVSTDRQDLACASGTEINGLHCANESQGKRWSKGDPNDDKKMLKPYSTTNGINFLAAGVWTDPGLPEKLPNSRFTLKCKLEVAKKMPRADVRWHEGEGWNSVTDWYAGSVSECKMGTVQN